MHARIERLPSRFERLDVVPLQLLLELPQDQVHAFQDGRAVDRAVGAAGLGRRTLQVVDDFQQIAQHRLAGLRDGVGLLFSGTLFPILEVGRDAQHAILELVAFGDQGCHALVGRLGR